MEQKIKLIVRTSRDEMIRERDNIVAEAGKNLVSHSDDTVKTKDILYMFKTVLIDRTPLVVIKSHNPHEIEIASIITEYEKMVQDLRVIEARINGTEGIELPEKSEEEVQEGIENEQEGEGHNAEVTASEGI